MPDLGLQDQIKIHFDFLITEKGYRKAESSPYRVRFESPTMFVEIIFDGNRSCELVLLIGTIPLGKMVQTPFSIDEILRMRRAPEAQRYSVVQVTNREALATYTAEVARLVRIYASDLIDGNKLRIAALLRQRQSEAKRYAIEQNLREARSDAEAAWRSKNYGAVIKAFEPFLSALTQSEIKKFKFCNKQNETRRK